MGYSCILTWRGSPPISNVANQSAAWRGFQEAIFLKHTHTNKTTTQELGNVTTYIFPFYMQTEQNTCIYLPKDQGPLLLLPLLQTYLVQTFIHTPRGLTVTGLPTSLRVWPIHHYTRVLPSTGTILLWTYSGSKRFRYGILI